jgi:hypothetical protein
MGMKFFCTATDCLRLARVHGLCNAHYQRLRRSGSVKAEQPILAFNSRKTRSVLGRIIAGKLFWHG